MILLRRIIFLVGIILTQVPVLAEVLILRDGSEVRGKITSQDAQKITVETDEKSIDIEKFRLYRIFYNEAQFESFKSKEGAQLKAMAEEAERVRKLQEDHDREWQEKLDRQKEEYESRLTSLREGQTAEIEKARLATSQEMRGALWRSALLPGWPQLRRGQSAGYLFLGSTALALLNLKNSYSHLNAAKRDFSDPMLPLAYSQLGATGLALNYQHFENKSARVRHAQASVNLGWIILATIWGAGLAHTLAFPPSVGSQSNLPPPNRKPDVTLGLNIPF